MTNEELKIIQEMQDELLDIIAERDELLKVVEKLPKTADGVPVVPETTVWYPEAGYMNEGVVRWDGGDYYAKFQPMDQWSPRVAVSDCYSTEQAAKEAGGE